MTTQSLRTRIDSILQFMAPHWSWVNCHMVNYFTNDHWRTYVPLELQKEIYSQDVIEECIETVFWNANEDASKFSEIAKFVQKALKHSLHAFEEIVKTPQQFEMEILGVRADMKKQIKIKEFLTEKKRHEVEVTAGLVHNLINYSQWQNNCVIVDAGDGKGYLSSRLSLEYGHTVLGIDSNTANTENAIARSKRLKKAWSSLKERAELELKGIVPARRGNIKQKRQQKSLVNVQACLSNENSNYKTIDKFITSDMDLDSLLQHQFPPYESTIKPTICLTGLHTCGNLAPACLRLFHNQNSCKILCNIGCCYHLLKEQFSGPEFFGNKEILDSNQEIGFPLSQYLQEKKITMGRNARMLAAQSIERTVKAKELPNISLFYRALMEKLICEQQPDLKECVQVGKIRKFNSFVEYVDLCRTKFPNLNLKNKKIAETAGLEERESKKYLDLFYLLRMTFAPVLESLILLDRLLYLKELGHNQSFVIPVFDPVVSPRHFAIIALKNE